MQRFYTHKVNIIVYTNLYGSSSQDVAPPTNQSCHLYLGLSSDSKPSCDCFLFLFLRVQENLKPETVNGVYHQQRPVCKCFSLIFSLLVSVYDVVSACLFSSLMQLLTASAQSLMRVAHVHYLMGKITYKKDITK